MSARPGGITYDVATALWQGARPYQEDTLLIDFHGGMDRGFAVLSDGMGGHAAGDLASRLVVIDAASHLKFLMHDGVALEESLVAELKSAIGAANEVLRDRAAEDRRLRGMGATFLATVLFEDRLYWASVGDSPLYLWREGKLRQLNADHSMAPVIDQMARSGEISRSEAANHPDRNALTSVLMGGAVKAMDVPATATVLDPGDVLIQASDGVQFLEDARICDVVSKGGNSRAIAAALMEALHALGDPAQDNVAMVVLQLTQAPESAVATKQTRDTTGHTLATLATPDARASEAAPPSGHPARGRARGWILPAGLLGAAAVAAGLAIGLPGLQTAPTQRPFETAAVVPADEAPSPALDAAARPLAPALSPVPLPAPAPAPAPAEEVMAEAGGALTRSLAPTPEAAADGAGVHDTISDASSPPAAGPAVSPTRIIADKRANPGLPAQGGPAIPATIQFGSPDPDDPPAPGANAVGLGPLTAPIDAATQSEGINAPEAGPDAAPFAVAPLLPQPVPAPLSQRAVRPRNGGFPDGG